MGRKSGGKANPRKAPAQRGLAAHHHGCALCLGMPAPQQGPGSKKKGEKKKEGEKFKRAPERQAARWGFLSPLVAGRSWGTRALRQAACAPPPSSAARATQNPAPRARRNVSRNLRCLSHRLHLSASAASDKKKNKINTNNGAKPQQNPILGHERWLGAPRHHSSLPHPPRSLLPWLPP